MIANTDAKTGLHDRDGFLKCLHREVIQCNETRTPLALVVIDIDGFAQINASHGYAIGDAVLRYMAAQLRKVTRKQDHAARIGDNRFALVLTGMLNHGHVELAVQKLQRLLDTAYVYANNRIAVIATAGAAVCPEHASHAEHLMRKAETALAAARRESRRYRMADDTSAEFDLSTQWELEMEFGDAIDRGELQMHYQPQVRIRDGEPVGAEALMRWERPGRGIISPDLFIPLAERTGQIRKVTVWALNTVLRQAASWSHDHGPLSVSVNLPGELATRRDLPELIENAMHLWGSKQVRLTLEITERSLMDRERSRNTLQQVRKLGVGISIDDFGTGYSCLAYFKNIPADELKIDKSFISEMLTDSASAGITTLIIELAHQFNLKVVGEGIESLQTLDMLRTLGCDIAQGFLLGKAMPSEAFEEWLKNRACTPAGQRKREPRQAT